MIPRCLVIHPGALGDVLLAGPALAHLRQLGYGTTLGVMPRLVGLFAGSGLVDAAQDLDSLALHRLFVDSPEPAALRPVAGYDAIVSWLGAGDPAFGASLARLGCPMVVARAAPPAGARRHVSQHLLETLAPLGPVPPEMPRARLDVSDVDRRAAETWLGARGLRPGEAVVLQPGAGSAAKAWPGFGSLARRLRDTGMAVAALAGPADGVAVERLIGTGALAEDALARDWPLSRVAALLSVARAAVGNDSGPTHLAAAVGCPTVALFGPTDPAVWAPLGQHVRVLSGGSSDAPWTGVTVDRVEAALRALLADRGIAPRCEPTRAAVESAWP